MPHHAIALYPTTRRESGCLCVPARLDRHDWDAGADAAAGDSHTMLRALRTRLHEALDAWPATTDTPQRRDAAMRCRRLSLDCAEALDQFHGLMIDEARRLRRREFDLHEART